MDPSLLGDPRYMDQEWPPRKSQPLLQMNEIYGQARRLQEEKRMIYQRLLEELRKKNPKLSEMGLHLQASAMMQQRENQATGSDIQYENQLKQMKTMY